MTYTLLVYLHLMATCVALGTIVLTDLRLLAKTMGYRVVIPPPERLETITISAALLLLFITGSAFIWIGLEKNPQYLSNEKLQAKLILVALLSANAFFLHKRIFPILGRSRPVSHWTRQEWIEVAASVSLSNSTWLFCAFLGIARVWNHTVPLSFVISVAGIAWLLFLAVVISILALASRDAPKEAPDWVDWAKAAIRRITESHEVRPPIQGKISDRRKYPRALENSDSVLE
jgi:hypothetical protein